MRIKVKNVLILVVVLVVIIGGSILGFKLYSYFTSDAYHLKKLGYNESEIKELTKMNKKDVKTILTLEYNEAIVPLFKEPYFILDNLNRYLDYKEKSKSDDYTDIVAIVNVGSDKDWYTDTHPTDMRKENLILVNKFNYLEDGYKPDDLVTMGLQYAFEGKEIREEVYDSFKSLVNAAKEEDLTIVANSTFRTSEYQQNLYDGYKEKNGKAYADNYAARAGYSEHQTGLSIDVNTYPSTDLDDFENTEEFTWLQNHAYEYGFILRYPKGKEHITGYNYESWHYRYVGVDVAKDIHKLGITFDEYYAYYIANH